MSGKAIRFLTGIGLLLACSLSARAQLPAFFNGAVQLGSHWNYLQFANGHLFGYYNEQYSPDVYHNDLGWEHVIDAGDGQNGVYLYDYAGSSWFYTTPALFPTLYDFALGHSLTYQLDLKQTGHYTSNPRKFIDLSTSQLITLGPAGTAIGLLPSTPNLLSITGGGSGGGNTGHAAPGVTGSFAFTFNDAFYGANYIVGGQVSLMDGTGQNHCQLSWGRPNTLDSSDGGFCTVSLVSIVNSTSDPTAVTVTLNYTFSGAAPPGDYSVIAMVCDKDVLCSPPGTVGTWTVDGTAPPLTIMTSSLPGATAGMPYSLTLSGTGGAGNYSWSAAGLPSGLTLSAAGVLSGTASPDGVSPITVTLADGAGGRVTANYGLTVAPQSLSSVTSSQGYTYNDGVSRSSNYCLGPQGGGCYATGNSQYLQSCSVRKPDGSQLPFSSVAVTPASNTPYFSVSYNASQTMPPDSGNLTCVYQGAVIHGPAVSIYDVRPRIDTINPNPVLQSLVPVALTVTGIGFGAAAPKVVIFDSSLSIPVPNVTVSVVPNACGLAGHSPTCIVVLVPALVPGLYQMTVQSTGNGVAGFQAGGTPASGSQSPYKAFTIAPAAPVISLLQTITTTPNNPGPNAPVDPDSSGYFVLYGSWFKGGGLLSPTVTITGPPGTPNWQCDTVGSPCSLICTPTCIVTDGQINLQFSFANLPIGSYQVRVSTLYGSDSMPFMVVPEIVFGGIDITGIGRPVVTGGQIGLTTVAPLPPGVTVTSQSWTVPGTTVGGFPGPLSPGAGGLQATDFNQDSTTFYWVDAGNLRVLHYNITLSNGQTLSSPAFFNVSGPSLPVEETDAGSVAVGVDPVDSKLKLALQGIQNELLGLAGAPGFRIMGGADTGIVFGATVTPPLYDGHLVFVQLLDNYKIDLLKVGSPTVGGCTFLGLDGGYPYGATLPNYAYDRPSFTVFDSLFDHINMSFQAHLYVMWQANQPFSIPVPLGFVTWSWGGAALFGPGSGAWSLVGSASNSGSAALFQQSTAYPAWATNTPYPIPAGLCTLP